MERETHTDRSLSKIKDNRFVSTIIVIAIVVIGIGTFTDAVDSIFTFFEKRLIANAEVEESTTHDLTESAGGVSPLPLAANAEQLSFSSQGSPEESLETPDSEDSSSVIATTEARNLPNEVEVAQEIATEDFAPTSRPPETDASEVATNGDQDRFVVDVTPPESVTNLNEQNVRDLGQVDIEPSDEAREALANDGQPEEAVVLVADIESAASSPKVPQEVVVSRFEFAKVIPSTVSRTDALLQVAKVAADNGYFDLAIEIAKEIPSTVTEGTAFAYIARAAFSANHPTAALTAANAIPSTVLRGEVLSEMATAPSN